MQTNSPTKLFENFLCYRELSFFERSALGNESFTVHWIILTENTLKNVDLKQCI